MTQAERERLLRVTRYWRAIQIAAALEGKDEDIGEDSVHESFTKEQFAQGRAPERFVAKAFAKADEELKPGQEPVQVIDVVMSPFRMNITGQRRPFAPVFAHARINRRNELLVKDAESEIPPMWIARPCFSPTDLPEMGIFPLGEAEEYYQHLQAQCRDMDTWPTTWPAMLQRFDEVWRTVAPGKPSFWQYVHEWPDLVSGTIWVEKHDPKKLTIIGMYERLIEKLNANTCPSLYRELVYGTHPHAPPPFRPETHLGQMGGKHPLADSQRTSLLSYLRSPQNGITAVNGPPGTGKTTLLQSVVATEMVSRALAEGEPPLFVASAATNQAVSNIIDAFKKATADLVHPLADRWIPGVGRRYGVYFRGSVGESLELAKGALVCIPSELKNQAKIDEPDAAKIMAEANRIADDPKGAQEIPMQTILALAETNVVHEAFVAQAGRHLGEVVSVEQVAAAALAKIRACKASIEKYCEAVTGIKTIAADVAPEKEELASIEMALIGRLAAAKSDQKALRNANEMEREKDRTDEADKRSREDEEYKAFRSSENVREKEASDADRKLTEALQAKLEQLDEVASRFSALAEPTTFMGWFLDMLPWVKARKLKVLMDIASEFYDAGLEDCPDDDLVAARKWMLSRLAVRRDLKAKAKNVDTDAGVRRSLSAKRMKDFLSEVDRRRLVRREYLESREAARVRTQADTEIVVRAIEKNIQEWNGAVSTWKAIASRMVPGNTLPTKISQIDGLPDTTLRIEAFLWATHYWEARFLMQARRSMWRDQGTAEGRYRLMAMLAPCFVSTFDKLGSAFNVMTRGVISPLWEFADTLIIDEAGQASPDKGSFAFGFARRALVVGDNYQLPPVTSEDCSAITRSTAQRLRLLNDQDLADRGALTGKFGLLQFPGSIMRMATAASWCHLSRNTKGLWLRDHFRCDDRIVALSNEIWYTGETSLIPQGKVRHKVGPEMAKVDRVIPPFGHVHVDGRRVDNVNRAEIAAVMEWIDHHGPELQRAYRKPIEEIVAVLTPFANQKLQLRKSRDSYRWNDGFADATSGVAGNPKKIKMGTAHVLQGAERPIILFSTVCDDGNGNYYFDKEHTLLNVAVTRAQDSFLVFGHQAVFTKRKKNASKPSTHLREHLFEKGYNAVPEVPKRKSA